MSQIFDSIKSLITPDMVLKAANVTGEKDTKVSAAVSSIIPGFLGALLKKGDTPQLKNTLEEAGRCNIIGNVPCIMSGETTEQEQSIGNRFLLSIFGNKTSDFNSAIASASGISNSSAGKLTNMLAPVVAGFLGNKMVNGNMSLSSLLSSLSSEKKGFMNLIPASVASTLGVAAPVTEKYAHGLKDGKKEVKKNNSWITWLIVIILLLLLLFWWRSCRRNHHTDTVVTTEDTVRASTYADTVRTNRVDNNTNNRVSSDYELPNGVRLTAYKGGAEDKMIAYLRGDDYKNASADDLKDKWFTFDNLTFEFDSSTTLMNNNRGQLRNIAEILKYYKDAKIEVIGFADKVGSDRANMEISKERAETIKKLLVDDGIAANRITTMGVGEKYAEHPASASDADRAEDRHVALRFVK